MVLFYSLIMKENFMSDYKPFEEPRILLACRRGMWELDLLLEPFAEACYETLNEAEKSSFHLLLEEDDPTLLSWFLHETVPEREDFINLIKKIKDHAEHNTFRK